MVDTLSHKARQGLTVTWTIAGYLSAGKSNSLRYPIAYHGDAETRFTPVRTLVAIHKHWQPYITDAGLSLILPRQQSLRTTLCSVSNSRGTEDSEILRNELGWGVLTPDYYETDSNQV